MNGITAWGMGLVAAVMVLTVSGCASQQAVIKNYKTVDASDGVTEREAKIMAQKEIMSAMEKRDYRITAPDIKTSPDALKYADYWFVVFGHNWFSPISTDPMAKTYTELRETQYLVVINKASGEIKFAGQWYPKRANNFDWLFEPEAYKKDRPLALPPGQKSIPVY